MGRRSTTLFFTILSTAVFCFSAGIVSAGVFTAETLKNTNLRKSPSLTASIITTLPAGKRFNIIGDKDIKGDKWFQVSFKKGRSGWLVARNVRAWNMSGDASLAERKKVAAEDTRVHEQTLDSELQKLRSSAGDISDKIAEVIMRKCQMEAERYIIEKSVSIPQEAKAKGIAKLNSRVDALNQQVAELVAGKESLAQKMDSVTKKMNQLAMDKRALVDLLAIATSDDTKEEALSPAEQTRRKIFGTMSSATLTDNTAPSAQQAPQQASPRYVPPSERHRNRNRIALATQPSDSEVSQNTVPDWVSTLLQRAVPMKNESVGDILVASKGSTTVIQCVNDPDRIARLKAIFSGMIRDTYDSGDNKIFVIDNGRIRAAAD